MRIYKAKYKRPDTGEVYESPKWSVQFHVQGRLYRKSLGTTDKRVAEERAAALRRKQERRSAGLLDPAEESRDVPVEQHLEAFESMLKSRGVSEAHLVDRLACLREFVDRSRATRLPDLDESRATKWLRDRKAEGLSARSVNRRFQAVRQFARWCIATRRLSWDPFASLRPLNERVDRRHVRRALTPDELARLLAAAERRPLEEKQAERVLKGVTPREQAKLLALGRARALAYAVAAGTGLRRGELKRLRWGDLDLEKRIVYVPAESAKSKRDQSVPLRSDLAAALEAYRPTDVTPAAVVFPGRLFPTLRTFKRDAVAAGLGTATRPKGATRGCEEYDLTDDSGRVVDFHALRVTFVSQLVAAGVHPRVAQALARHSKVETTMAVYTDLAALDLRGAVESLVEDGRPKRAKTAGVA
jgi:integrase